MAGPAHADAPATSAPAQSAAYHREGTEGALTVSWHDIVRFVDQHPRLVASRFDVVAAKAAVTAAGAIPNPSLDAAIGHGAARDGDQTRIEEGFELTIPLGWLAQRASKIAAAQAELDASQSTAEVLRREVLLQLRMLFWAAAYDQANVAALETLERQTADLARTVQRRVEKGETRLVEQTRMEVERERVANDLEAARVSQRVNREQLRLWLGDVNELKVEADLSAIPKAVDLEAALAEARSGHPAIRAAQAMVRARSSELAVEKLSRIPGVAIKGFAENELDRRAYGGGLELDLPVWNWNSGRIAQAEAQLAAGEQQLAAEVREIVASILEAHGACLATSQTATRIKERILPRSEAAAFTMERTYQLGEASLLETIDARRVLAETHRQYLTALVQAHIDCGRFHTLVGEGDDE